jgi:hypothetical protein
MSLNRREQLTHDYLLARPDERRHWESVVRGEAARAAGDAHAAAAPLERALWAYFEERAAVTEPFRGEFRREGAARTSMKNLAELLLRLWAPPPAPAAAVQRPRDKSPRL